MNWNNSEGEVSGDLGLFFLLMIMASIKNTGDAYTPPGIINIRIPMIAGIHHGFFEVWVEFSSLLGIQV